MSEKFPHGVGEGAGLKESTASPAECLAHPSSVQSGISAPITSFLFFSTHHLPCTHFSPLVLPWAGLRFSQAVRGEKQGLSPKSWPLDQALGWGWFCHSELCGPSVRGLVLLCASVSPSRIAGFLRDMVRRIKGCRGLTGHWAVTESVLVTAGPRGVAPSSAECGPKTTKTNKKKRA